MLNNFICCCKVCGVRETFDGLSEAYIFADEKLILELCFSTVVMCKILVLYYKHIYTLAVSDACDCSLESIIVNKKSLNNLFNTSQ